MVVACWTTHALTRDRVLTECNLAREQGKLVPVEIGEISDDVLTVAYSRIDRCDLREFDGAAANPSWQKLVRSLERRLGKRDLLKLAARRAEEERKTREAQERERERLARLERQNEALKKSRRGLKPWHWYASITTVAFCVAAASWFGITYGEHMATNEIRSSIIPTEVQDQIKQFEINSNIDPRDQLADWYSRIPLPRLVEASTMDPEAALLAGWGYKFGVGGTLVNQSEATLMFQRACDGNLARGCRNLALQYASGLGVAENDELANSLFRRACDLGDDPACLALENRGKLSNEKSVSGSD